MTAVAFITHADCGRHDTGWNHPEHPGRLRAIPRALRNDPALYSALEHVEARHATIEELSLAHDPAYIQSIEAIAARGGGAVEADTLTSSGSWAAACAAAGAVLTGTDMALQGSATRSFCAVRPPGHHALRDAAMGFCLFGNVAIGARYARQVHGLERVLIVDWDVHHGNGTQALIEDDPGIHFVSLHQAPWYPGTGAASDRGRGNVWNVPMPPGRTADVYIRALTDAIERATTGFIPELVFISAGFDSLRGDPLGGFTLEMEHVAELTRYVVAGADAWCQGRVVSALEGGYVPDRLAQACAAHLAALL